MKIRIRAAGGLGNQLLQYFGALYISQQLNEEVIFDLSEIDLHHTLGKYDLRSFNEPAKSLKICKYSALHPTRLCLKALRRLLRHFRLRLTYAAFQEDRNDIQSLLHSVQCSRGRFNSIEISGWFANFDYFHNLPQVLREISLSSPSRKFFSCKNYLAGCGYIAIHLRFGDYLENPSLHGVLTREYYDKALEALGVDTYNDNFVFFSNDNSKLNEFIDLSKFRNVTLIDDSPEFDPAEVLVLMGGATKIVTSNSTFSYLAALLAPAAIVAFPRVNIRGEEFILNAPTNWIEIPPHWL